MPPWLPPSAVHRAVQLYQLYSCIVCSTLPCSTSVFSTSPGTRSEPVGGGQRVPSHGHSPHPHNTGRLPQRQSKEQAADALDGGNNKLDKTLFDKHSAELSTRPRERGWPDLQVRPRRRRRWRLCMWDRWRSLLAIRPHTAINTIEVRDVR